MKKRNVGGRLCLDFVNTVDPRHGAPREEHLPDYESLVGWAEQAGIVASDEAARLTAAARREPAAARRAHEEAIDLRETLYSIFGAVARGEPPGSVSQLNAHLARTQPRLVGDEGGFAWGWAPGDDLDRILWPVAWSAAELLAQGPLERVRECPGDDTCGWLFLDTSRNGSRRWCDMSTCGNRSKARRYYRRVRTARS